MNAVITESDLALLCAIKRVVAAGNNAKVTTGKDGITVYEEKVKKIHINKPQS